MGATRTSALLSWSGGKDAAWTLHALRQAGDVEVVGLLCTLTEGRDRASMQGVRREVSGSLMSYTGMASIPGWKRRPSLPQGPLARRQRCSSASFFSSFSR